MKTRSFLIAAAAAFVVACSVTVSFATQPLGPGFTYQGRLNDGGAPANGHYDMIFNLYDAPTNGNVLGSFSIFGAVPVTNGLFTVELNAYNEFGTNAFTCSVMVENFDKTALDISKNGGQVALPKFAVPGKCWQGYFIDIDNNVFGIFEVDEKAK